MGSEMCIRDSNTSDFAKFLVDVKDPNYPEGYTFIEPNYGDVISGSFKPGSSQHPMDGVYGGELLIKKTYEAIRNSPHWNNCVLIILYDEHGGFYDSVAPGAAPPPNDWRPIFSQIRSCRHAESRSAARESGIDTAASVSSRSEAPDMGCLSSLLL